METIKIKNPSSEDITDKENQLYLAEQFYLTELEDLNNVKIKLPNEKNIYFIEKAVDILKGHLSSFIYSNAKGDVNALSEFKNYKINEYPKYSKDNFQNAFDWVKFLIKLEDEHLFAKNYYLSEKGNLIKARRKARIEIIERAILYKMEVLEEQYQKYFINVADRNPNSLRKFINYKRNFLLNFDFKSENILLWAGLLLVFEMVIITGQFFIYYIFH